MTFRDQWFESQFLVALCPRQRVCVCELYECVPEVVVCKNNTNTQKGRCPVNVYMFCSTVCSVNLVSLFN